MLVRAVRDLVAGTEAVEGGDLDTEVAVTSTDEIGRLTGSFNHMVGELRLKERIKETFGKYMDPRIVSNLLDHPEFAEPGGERREMTVMFIDLKGFTSISEVLAPDDLVHLINRFFGHMTDAISDNKGVVDKFMGDAVMAYWGPPFTDTGEHAHLACRAAAQALDHLEKFRDDMKRELGAKADGTRAMISECTLELAGAGVTVRELDLIRVKGKHEPTRVYDLLAAPEGKAALESFQAGLDAYRRHDWDAAEAAFKACLETDREDPAAAVYLERVAHLRAEPPAKDWDGVWVFETK